MHDVIISRPLALDEKDPAWLALKKMARIHVRTAQSKATLANHPKLKTAAALITMVTDPINVALLKRAPNLIVIANHAVGFNNIDLAATKARGIVVCNTPEVLTNATAELTISLLFAAARRFEEGTVMIQKKRFLGWHPRLLLGRELAGARLGIVGHGRIGRRSQPKRVPWVWMSCTQVLWAAFLWTTCFAPQTLYQYIARSMPRPRA